MASPVISALHSNSSKTSGTLLQVNGTSTAIAAGDLVVVCLAMDPSGAVVSFGQSTTATLSSFTVIRDVANSTSSTSGVRVIVAYATVLTSGTISSVDVTFSSSVTAKSGKSFKVTGTDGNSPIWNSATGTSAPFLNSAASPYGDPQNGYQYTILEVEGVEGANGSATNATPTANWGLSTPLWTYVSSDASSFGTSGQGASSNISIATGWCTDTYVTGYATGISAQSVLANSSASKAMVAVVFIAPWTVQTCSPTQIGGVVSSKTYFENVADGTAPSSANTGASLTVYSTPTIVTDGVLGKAINLSDNNLDLVFMAFGDTTQLSGTFQCDFNIVSSSNNGTIIAIHSGSGTSFVSLKIGGINTFYLFDATRQVGTNSPTFSINTKYTCTLWADLMTRKVGVVVRDSSGAIFWETSGTSTYDQLAADATAKIIDAAINSGGNNTRFKNLATSVGISRGISDVGLPAIDISLPSTRPTAVASTEAFGTPVLAPKVTATLTGVASAQAFGTPVISFLTTSTLTGIATVEAFGNPTLAAFVTSSPTGVATVEAFGVPVLSTKVTSTIGAGPASAEAFGAITLTPVTATTLTGIATVEAFGNPTLAMFVTSNPTGVASAEVFGTTVLSPKITSTVGAGPASSEAFSMPTIDVILLAQSITLAAIASAEVFGNPTLASFVTSSPTGVASLEATGNPSLATFVTAQPTQIASAEILGTPSLTAKVTSSFFGIATAEAFGAPTLVWPTTTFPTNIASAELLGNPILGGMVALSPIMIASAEALGVPNLGASLASIPNAIASAEALGNPTLAAKVTAGLTGIASLNAFGALALSTIIGTNPTQIASTELFGNPALSSFVTVNWLGIGTAEAYGTPSIAARITSALTGIASAGALGTPSLLAKIASLPTGIASAEIFNDLVIDAALRIFPVPIDTLEAVSILTLDTFIELIPDAIDTAEVFGDLFMGQIVTSHVTAGIPTAVEFGVPTINPVIDMLPVGIITTEIIPAPVLVAYVGVSPEAIDTAEVVNDPILDLHTAVLLSGIASVGSMGAITVTPFIVSTPTGVISLEAFGLLDAELLARVEFAGWGLPVG